jgi:hypothetical protein
MSRSSAAIAIGIGRLHPSNVRVDHVSVLLRMPDFRPSTPEITLHHHEYLFAGLRSNCIGIPAALRASGGNLDYLEGGARSDSIK